MLEQEKWDAINKSDASFDGIFYYGVKTTKIFCRPSCRSKKPLLKNTLFFRSPGEAVAAGFRPCKRCRPDLLEYAPAKTLCEQVKSFLEDYYKDTNGLKLFLKSLGVSETHISRLFYKEYGLKLYEYIHKLRIGEAKLLISGGRKTVDAAFECGYGSLSSFYKHFNDIAGMTPKRYVSR